MRRIKWGDVAILLILGVLIVMTFIELMKQGG